jgi:hypothetical protein
MGGPAFGHQSVLAAEPAPPGPQAAGSVVIRAQQALMEQGGLDRFAAYQVLSRRARAERRRIATVAADVLRELAGGGLR